MFSLPITKENSYAINNNATCSVGCKNAMKLMKHFNIITQFIHHVSEIYS
jgi:hypothetical protein